jgi:hypothetical protein
VKLKVIMRTKRRRMYGVSSSGTMGSRSMRTNAKKIQNIATDVEAHAVVEGQTCIGQL